MPKLLPLLFCSFIAFPGAALAQFTGVVVGVDDGDTLMVMIDRHLLKLDLIGINAPETGQPYAARARQSLEEMCEEKPAVVDDLGVGRGKHMFGRIICGGVDAAAEQVRRGLAWAGVRGAPASASLASIEAGAKAGRRGLWNDEAPVPPSKWQPGTGTMVE